MGTTQKVRFGKWGDDWLLGVCITKLGIEDHARTIVEGLFSDPERYQTYLAGKRQAGSATWDDVSDELFRMREPAPLAFDRLVGAYIGTDGLNEVLGAIARRGERREYEKTLVAEALAAVADSAGDMRRERGVCVKKMGRSVEDVRGQEVKTSEEFWAVLERVWARVVGVRPAEGPDLVATAGEMIKVRVRGEKVGNFAKGGLMRCRRLTGGIVEFLGPYFGDRVAHVRWSAVKRAEWRKQWAWGREDQEAWGRGQVAGGGEGEAGLARTTGGSLLADSGAQCGAGGSEVKEG
jgi:hypothetical protein